MFGNRPNPMNREHLKLALILAVILCAAIAEALV